MKSSHRSAFTLIELLVVIVIIAVLASVALPIFNSVRRKSQETQSMSNMRQLTAAALAYASDNDGALPIQGDKNPSWAGAAAKTSAETTAWYNALPRTYANSRGLGDYAANPAAFYTKGSMFFVPAAVYPASATKLGTPQFAFGYNSKLFTGTVTSVRLPVLTLPAETVLFQENGLPNETPLKGQKTYTNQSCGYASRTAARYTGQTILTFIDGHASGFSGASIVNPSNGNAYFAPYPSPFPVGAATVYWEADPTVSPN